MRHLVELGCSWRFVGDGGARRAASWGGCAATFEDVSPYLPGLPGPRRAQPVAAVLSGAKATTAALSEEYEAQGEALPEAAARPVSVGSAGRR